MENHKNPSQDSLFPGQELNQGPPEYEARELINQPLHSDSSEIYTWQYCLVVPTKDKSTITMARLN
jgi:hypothetical protein